MVNGGPGPGQATGTVFRPKIESQHIEFIFSKIIIFRVIFQGHPSSSKSDNIQKIEKKNILEFFLEFFLKMGIGGPGPGQAAGTVWRPKILQNPKKYLFFKNRVIFKGHPCRI